MFNIFKPKITVPEQEYYKTSTRCRNCFKPNVILVPIEQKFFRDRPSQNDPELSSYFGVEKNCDNCKQLEVYYWTKYI